MNSDGSDTPRVLSDPSHDIFGSEPHPLDFIFRPRTVAVIGATDRQGSVGRAVLENLLHGSSGQRIYAVNPRHNEVLGVRCYPAIRQIQEAVDVAVVITPAATVPGVIRECVAAGVRGAVIISAGFKEIGAEGALLEAEILREARRGQLRLIGPNCLGIMNPPIGLNATFAQNLALSGSVAFLSQSGALCTAILDWSQREAVGFSAFVSTGSMLDVGWGDLIYYFGDDFKTRSILIYMESIGDPRSFLSAAREVARTKPIIVIKAGRTEAAAKAAASHTGAMTGSDEVLDAAFRRCGVLRVNRIAELFEMADVLSKQPRPRGPRLAIMTNAGGAGVLATDALLEAGGELASLSPDTIGNLDALLPAHWSHANPVDILGDADVERYRKALDITLRDSESDGFLAILAPQGIANPTEVARRITSCSRPQAPILAAWMGGDTVSEGARLLNRAGIPAFDFPDEAARAFTYLWRYSANLRSLNETPAFVSDDLPDAARAPEVLGPARSRNRTLLTEWESKQLLAIYGIPTVQTELANNPDEAVRIAEQISYPVVVKLHSETISHKTDVGGVLLDLATPEAVRTAFEQIRLSVSQKAGEEHFLGVTVQPMLRRKGYELILGCVLDPQFGPVLLFGTGGELVEVLRDRALGLPPLTTTLARRMMEQTRIYGALQGVRGRRAVDLPALESVLVRFSQLVAEQRLIREIDINPLLVSEEQIVALDARVVMHSVATDESQIPRLAIRPYPVQYVSTAETKNGSMVRIRPIRPEDEPAMVQFHKRLSESTVYMRYLGFLKLEQRIAHERLARICFIDYDREMVLVAELFSPSGQGEIVGVGRLSKLHGRNEAEFAVLIRDDFQRLGLGSELLTRLVGAARDEKLDRVVAVMSAENIGMRKIALKAGFRLEPPDGNHLVTAAVELSQMQRAVP